MSALVRNYVVVMFCINFRDICRDYASARVSEDKINEMLLWLFCHKTAKERNQRIPGYRGFRGKYLYFFKGPVKIYRVPRAGFGEN